MILKKDLIDGKKVYVEIDEEEARELYKKGEKLFFGDDDEKDEFYDRMEELDEEEEELEEEYEDEDEDEDEDYSSSDSDDLKTRFQEIGRKAQKISVELGKRVSEIAEKVINPDVFNFNNYNEKTRKLVAILPYMDDEDIHDLIQDMLQKKDAFKDIDIRAIFPFLTEDDCDAIFMSALDGGNYELRLKDIAPFVSSECLTKVVDLYLEGKFTSKDIEKIYPFLSSEDIKRVFKHMMDEK